MANGDAWRHIAALSEFGAQFLNGMQRSVNRKVQGSNPWSGAKSEFKPSGRPPTSMSSARSCQITSCSWLWTGEKAEGYLKTRYERMHGVLYLTLPRLLSALDGRDAIAALRADGWLDWRILSSIANVAMNWRAQQANPRDLNEQTKISVKYMQEERSDFPLVPLGQFWSPSEAPISWSLDQLSRSGNWSYGNELPISQPYEDS